jgi:hypothetical protein
MKERVITRIGDLLLCLLYVTILCCCLVPKIFCCVGSVGIQLLVMMLWLAAVQGTD